MSRNDSTRIKAQIDSVSSKLNQMDVVVSIKTDGFVGMKKSDIARAIEKEYAKFGNRVDRQNFGIILLEYNQINKALEYLNTDGEKAALLTVPRVLKRGVMADSHTEHKDRGVDSVTFAAPVEINGKRGNVGVVVQRVAGTNRFKTLRILLPNGKAFEFVQNKEADSTSGSSSKQKGSEGIPIESASGDIIRSEKEIVKKKFAMREPVEYTKDLVALHNLTEDKLTKALELGGFPMPSIAVTKSDIPHTNFGEITLVFGRETIDPKESKKNTVYSADAWTPTFPRVEYEENRDVGNRIYGQLDGISKKVDEFFRRDLGMVYTYIEGNLNRYGGEEGLIQHAMENYGLKAAYLEEQGKHIEQVTAQAEADLGFNPESAEKYRKIMDILGVSDADAIGKLNLKETREKYGAELEKAFPGITKSPFRMSRIFSQVQKYLNNKDAGPVYQTVTDESATKKAVDDALDMEGFEAWTRKLFSGIEKDSGVYNQKDIFTPAGNRRSFQQTHLPFTLDNIVKAMAAQNGGNTKNVSGFNGIKTLRAGTAERFKSIADMHKREGRLQNLTKEQLQDIQDSLQSRLYSVMEAIDKENDGRGESNSLIRYDSIGQIIMEISEGGKYNVADIQNVFRKYSREISDDTALEVKQLLYDVSQMPVNIFEAKPERAVRFDEVKAAILPKGTDQRIVDGLTNNGVPVQFYESGNNDERLKIVNSMENLKFSDREESDPSGIDTDSNLNYHKENANRQEVNGNERREESREDFDRRTSTEVLRKGQKGRLAYAYRPYLGTLSKNAKAAREGLKKIGIPVFIYEKLETNREGITTSHEKSGASTIPGVGVFIPFDADIDSMEIAGHEGFHFFAASKDRESYTSVLLDNIYFASAEFISYQTKYVQDNYFGEEVGTEGDYFDLLMEEIFAYITGDIQNGDPNGEVHKFLRDYNAVKDAWGDFIKKQATSGDGQTRYSTRETDNIGNFDGSNPDILMQDRPEESVSNRSLLANALESTAKNDIERKKIQEYKEKIELLNSEEQKLQELNAHVKELSFAKGPRDTAKIRALRDEAVKAANRINTYDRMLLRLEASQPLQNVLEREKKAAYKKAEQKGKEALEEYRDYEKKRQFISKIKIFKKNMENRLLRPTDRQYVPVDLIKAMVEVCDIIDTDTDLYKTDGSINKAQLKREQTKEKLQNLKDEYEKLKTNSDPIYAGEFDDMVYAYLTELRDRFSGKGISELSLDDLREMYDILRSIDETLTDARKLILRWLLVSRIGTEARLLSWILA